MNTLIKLAVVWSLGALTLIFLNACETTSASDNARVLKEPVKIYAGMSSTEVLSQLGEPIRERQMEIDGALVKAWFYKFISPGDVGVRFTGTREVPEYNPYTGELRMVQESIYTPETTEIIETIEIFFENERIVYWDQKIEKNRETVE